MKLKAPLRRAVDVLMTLGLLVLMGYQCWGEVAHEWVGAGMFLLFVLHHLLNIGWYRGLLRGKYAPVRVVQLVVNGLLLLAMLGLMVSGVLLSRHVFAFLGRRGGLAVARLLHMAASHWGFVLMSLHLGLHWGAVLGMARRRWPLPDRVRRILCPTLVVGVAVYGLIAFIRRDLPTCLLVRTQFVFLDFSEPIPLFYLDCLAIMGLFICLGWYATRGLRKLSEKKQNKSGGRSV